MTSPSKKSENGIKKSDEFVPPLTLELLFVVLLVVLLTLLSFLVLVAVVVGEDSSSFMDRSGEGKT